MISPLQPEPGRHQQPADGAWPGNPTDPAAPAAADAGSNRGAMDRRRFLAKVGAGGVGVGVATMAPAGLLTPEVAADVGQHTRRRGRVTAIRQVAVYHGATPTELFDLYTTSAGHSAATHPASGQVRWIDPTTGAEHPRAAVGLIMEGFPLPDGRPGLTSKVLRLEPGKLIIQEWINFAWQLATTTRPSTRPSLLRLDFRTNTVGAQIELTQRRLPTYPIDLTPSPFTDSGEQGPLSEIVRVHWELLYWQPIRQYLFDQGGG